MSSVPRNNVQKPPANIVTTMPVTCVAKATTSIDFSPMKSTIAPPMMTDNANPQKAIPVIQPTLVLSSANSVPHVPRMSPRTAKVIAVATSAMQLAMNNNLLCLSVVKAASCRPFCVLTLVSLPSR